MRHIYLTVIFSGLTLCLFGQTISPQEDFKKLAWLEGMWIRLNIKPEKKAYEQWRKSSEYELVGKAVTLVADDTVFVEKTNLIIKDNSMYYVADVPQNKQPVYFKVTSITNNGFICENPEHDFPKKITYRLAGNQLKATISGNGKSFDYLYQKKE